VRRAREILGVLGHLHDRGDPPTILAQQNLTRRVLKAWFWLLSGSESALNARAFAA
jgi:hypothetical protein